MGITSLLFFGFLAVVLIAYYVVPKKAQWIILLVASVVFFAYSSKLLIVYMIATTLLIYLGGLKIQGLNEKFKEKKKELDSREQRKALKADIKKKQHAIITIIVIACIGLLGALKYCNFFGGIINGAVGLFGATPIIPAFSIVIPIGISYYTLMSVSYIVDVYRGSIKAENNYFKLLLFVCYFPHITEGPFDTYDKLAPQFVEEHKFDYDSFVNALCLLLLGLVKKMVLADRLSYISNEVFDNYTNYSGISILIGMISYTLYIYFDFSGCIDAVRGVSRLFGIDIAENFSRPFFSRSIQEFWRRWHITLGAWLKSYVFYPVSLSKLSKSFSKKMNTGCKNKYYAATIPTFLPLICVWLTMGIWHGASWKYIVYGLYYFFIIFIGLIFEPIFAKKLENARKLKGFEIIQIIRTNALVVIGLTMFRADTISIFCKMLKSLASTQINVMNIVHSCVDLHKLDYLLIFVLVVVFFIKEIFEEQGKDVNLFFTSNKFKRWLWITVAIIAIILLGIYGSGYTEQASAYAEF